MMLDRPIRFPERTTTMVGRFQVNGVGLHIARSQPSTPSLRGLVILCFNFYQRNYHDLFLYHDFNQSPIRPRPTENLKDRAKQSAIINPKSSLKSK